VLLARARSEPRQLLAPMKSAAKSVNERVIPDARLLVDDFARQTGERRAMSALLSGLALLAVSLTCIGVFGIVSYAATLRRKELGIRVALGANRRSVVLTLVREVRWPLQAGIAFGLFAALPFAAVFAGAPLYVQALDIPVLTS